MQALNENLVSLDDNCWDKKIDDEVELDLQARNNIRNRLEIEDESLQDSD